MAALLNTLNPEVVVNAGLARLSDLLARQFGATAPEFARQVQAAEDQLPEELARALEELAATAARLRVAASVEAERLADFGFRCGQVYEQLEVFRRLELELENVRLGPASIEASPLQGAQVERLARFIEVRDRIFRKVADFTLKALLVGLGLLTLGLILGLV
jgi:hypothetical protein